MQFIFNNNIAAVIPFLDNAAHYLNEVLQGNPEKESIVNRCKFILSELCTNAVKHAGKDTSVIEIIKIEDHITISKTDQGTPLQLFTTANTALNVTTAHNGESFVIMEDDINCLVAQKRDNNRICFQVKAPHHNNAMGAGKLIEHYGLIIICQAADEFMYTHDNKNNSNIFTAVIKTLH